jgi:hypothetical protein
MRKFKYLLLSEIGFINVYELIIKKANLQIHADWL